MYKFTSHWCQQGKTDECHGVAGSKEAAQWAEMVKTRQDSGTVSNMAAWNTVSFGSISTEENYYENKAWIKWNVMGEYQLWCSMAMLSHLLLGLMWLLCTSRLSPKLVMLLRRMYISALLPVANGSRDAHMPAHNMFTLVQQCRACNGE